MREVRGVLGVLVRRVRALFRRDSIASDLDEEMRLHLELRQQRLEVSGVPAAEAYTAARRRFGNPSLLREAGVDAWGWRWIHDLRQDGRYALRGFVRHKAFTLTAVLSLALGIGANAAIFSVVNGVVLAPLPFPEPDQLVRLYGTSQLMPQRDILSNLAGVRRDATSLAAIAGCEVGARYLRRPDGAVRVMTVTAERDFFAVLQSPPLIGRTFGASDAGDTAVLGERFWQREFGGDRGVLDRTLTLDDRTFTVVGVMPERFQYPYRAGSLLPGAGVETRTDVWLSADAAATGRGRFSHVIARLRPGATLGSARAELSSIGERLRAQVPAAAAARRGYEVVALADDVVGTAVTRPLFLLLGAVGVVLALACANVANLLLVRMTRRDREVAVRLGLGAGPLRLVRQFLAESLVLSFTGGVAGLLLGWWTSRRLVAAASADLPRAHEIGLDWRVFAFLLLVSAAIGVLVGLVPALVALRRDPRGMLQGGDGRSTMSLAQRRLRDALVVAEVALAFCLAVGAALLVRELLRLRATDLGMETRNVLTVHLGRRMPPYGREGPPEGATRRFYDIAARVRALPGVRAAGFTQMLPLQSWGWFSNSSDFFEIGRAPLQPVFPIELRFVTPDYFRALGIQVTRGRGFADSDTRATPMVLVINEALARRQFGSSDPIGRKMNRGTIVGVVSDVRSVNPDQPPRLEIYTAIGQNWSQVSELGMTLVVSTTGAPETIVDAVRSIVRDVDPLLAVFEIKTMDRVVADSLALFRLVLWLFTGFALLAVILAVTGTYGVISYSAAARAREFAVRMALGADPGRVARAVLRQGLTLTACGLAAGVVAGFLAAPLLRNLPVTVRPPDPVIMAPVLAIVAVVSFLACLLPALRAARVDPMSVLRNE